MNRMREFRFTCKGLGCPHSGIAEARILFHITVFCVVKGRCLKMNRRSTSHIAPLTVNWEELPRGEFLDALLFSEVHAISSSNFSEESV